MLLGGQVGGRAITIVVIDNQWFAQKDAQTLLSPTFNADDMSQHGLGFGWGHLDLIHWPAAPQRGLFTLTSAGKPGYFLPERAAEGETVPGLILSFELPSCPAPLATFDAMALALAHFRETLGGRPTDSGNRELDTERLEAERESVAGAVAQLQQAGITPGSREALALF